MFRHQFLTRYFRPFNYGLRAKFKITWHFFVLMWKSTMFYRFWSITKLFLNLPSLLQKRDGLAFVKTFYRNKYKSAIWENSLIIWCSIAVLPVHILKLFLKLPSLLQKRDGLAFVKTFYQHRYNIKVQYEKILLIIWCSIAVHRENSFIIWCSIAVHLIKMYWFYLNIIAMLIFKYYECFCIVCVLRNEGYRHLDQSKLS